MSSYTHIKTIIMYYYTNSFGHFSGDDKVEWKFLTLFSPKLYASLIKSGI